MRRKNTRGTPKKASPAKKASRGRPTRRSQKSSDEESEVEEMTVDKSDDEQVASAETSIEVTPSSRSRRRKNVVNYDESLGDSPPQRRSGRNSDFEELKGGKGKSKKNKKIEKATSNEVAEPQANSEIIENVQVTAQSPQNVTDIVSDINAQSEYDNENDKQSENNKNDTTDEQSQDTITTSDDTNDNLKEDTVNHDSENDKNEDPAENSELAQDSEPIKDDSTENSENDCTKNSEVDETSTKKSELAQDSEILNSENSELSKKDSELVEASPKNSELTENSESAQNDSNAEEKIVVEEKHDNKIEETQKEDEKPSPRKRRMSSVKTDEAEEEPKPEKLSTKRIKLNRKSSEDVNIPTRAKRNKWNSTGFINKIVDTVQKVDIETLKNVCPKLEFLSENELKLEEVDNKNRKSLDEEETIEEEPNIESDNANTNNIIAMNRKISIVDDTASKLNPPPSPAKNELSDVLFITNLVRPFTIKQLRELLERTGKIKDEGFWTDRIKSKCYVQYETKEEAEATRNALHGVNWPIGNGKKLVIDYGTVEDFEKAKNPPVAAPLVEKMAEKENKQPEISDQPNEDDNRRKSESGHVREWDVGKEDLHRKRSTSRSRERARKVSRRSASPAEEYPNKKQRKQEEAVPQKVMDDLFLKTKAMPSIYWQPLSPEEIAMKQQQRLVRMEEHKRRMEENTRNRGGGRSGNFRRR